MLTEGEKNTQEGGKVELCIANYFFFLKPASETEQVQNLNSGLIVAK